TLSQRIHRLIEESGPLRFCDFMALALYDPAEGYYASGTAQVGRGGDFYTSVSVGPLFGHLLARRFAAEWQNLGRPALWRITECGAHDGRLALDILENLRALEPSAYQAVQYAIIEPLPSLQAAQRLTLREHPQRLLQSPTADNLDPLPGVVFGNEVLDALPCRCIEWRDGGWRECAVGLDARGALEWRLMEPREPALLAALAGLGNGFDEGYRSEVRSVYPDFLAPLARCLKEGLMLWIDYGFEREDYYHPDRREGTLRTYCKHQAGADPLLEPGTLDISAHVDFTAVSHAAAALGGKPLPLLSQGMWLTSLAREWLLAQEGRPDPAAIRQFQTLTHPAHLGRSFQVLEIRF
ncbi:MAG TPA: SAM-dependent methyltransferase, partial [Luteolibacter sp.]|nr:SAM-dependent methyltransferase [Luteolibacter sp.]